MRGRTFIAGIGTGAAVPPPARAQQPERVRRIGWLMYLAADDVEAQARLAAFTQALKQLGWNDGRNLRIDTRWATAIRHSKTRGGIGRAGAGRPRGWYWHCDCGAVATGDPRRADRVCACHRPGRR